MLAPAQMGEALLNETVEDMERIVDSLVISHDRWSKYSRQFADVISPQVRDAANKGIGRILAKLAALDQRRDQDRDVDQG